ncbi:hypothetical protein JCM10207_007232 [Rhodosporidiobolus poonsookiae]
MPGPPSFQRQVESVVSSVHADSLPPEQRPALAAWQGWFKAAAHLWARTGYHCLAKDKRPAIFTQLVAVSQGLNNGSLGYFRTDRRAIPQLFKGIEAAGAAAGASLATLRTWRGKWEGYVAAQSSSWTEHQLRTFIGGLIDMLAYARHYGETAFEGTAHPVHQAALALAAQAHVPVQVAMDLRALGHRQRRVYGQERATGDPGAEARRQSVTGHC